MTSIELNVFDLKNSITESDEAVTELIRDLQKEGGTANITKLDLGIKRILDPDTAAAIVMLISASVASAGGVAVIAAFVYRVFKTGIILDLRGEKPTIRKEPSLPRGSMLTFFKDGRQELKEALTLESLIELMKAAMSLGRSSGSQEEASGSEKQAEQPSA